MIVVLIGFHVQTVHAQNKAKTLHELNSLLINTVMVDFFTPPVAARIYSYPNIAFYECIRQDDPALPALSGKLNGLNILPSSPESKQDKSFYSSLHFVFLCGTKPGWLRI